MAIKVKQYSYKSNLVVIIFLSLSMWICGFESSFASNLSCPKVNVDYQNLINTPQNSVLYEVHDCKNGHIGYVFGTYHTSAPAILKGLNQVKPYLKQANQAWFEIDMKAQNSSFAQKLMMLPSEDDGLQAIIGADYFSKLLAIFQRKNPNISASIINRYKPWAAAISLQVLEVDLSGEVMDDVLQQYAIENNIKIKPLETAIQQLQIFDKLSKTEQITFLRDSIDNYAIMAKLSRKLEQSYILGDLKNLSKIAEENLSLGDATLTKKIELELIEKRNDAMAAKLLKILNKNNIFVAIGALHLSGENGVLQQFENAGYGVHAIPR